MYIDPRNPQLQKFQAAKEERRRKAIMRKEIATVNPKLTPRQIDQVIEAKIALDIQQVARDQEAAIREHRRPKFGGNARPKQKPQIANQSLAIGLSHWLGAKK